MKTLKDKCKSQIAITLVALVVTIIVLLILAGISITILVGDNGILKLATKAKQESEQATNKEIIKLAVISNLNIEQDEKVAKIEEELRKSDSNAIVYQSNICIEIEYKNNKYLMYPNGEFIEVINQSSDNNWLYQEDTHIYNGKRVAKRTITDYIGPKTEEVTIPNFLDGVRVVSINNQQGKSIFEANDMKSVIKKIKISEGIEDLHGMNFMNCVNLSGEIIIPNSVTHIGPNSFLNDINITSLKIGNNVREIKASAFLKCENLKGTLIIPDSVEIIGQSAFQGTSFSKAIFGNGVKNIGINAFNDSKISGELIIPNSVEEIGFGAFRGCSGLTGTLNIPNKVTTIGEGAFYNTNFDTIQIDNTINSIEGASWGSTANITWLKK